MSLTSALHATYAGISVAESKISVVSSNITNAEKPGYTVKRYQTEYSTANGIMIPISGTIKGNLNADLYEGVIESNTEYRYSLTIANYLEQYVDTVGTTGGSDSLSSHMNRLETAVSELETTPSDTSAKVAVVSAAQSVARELRALSGTVQGLRLDADQAIEESAETFNTLLENLDDLNRQVMILTTTNSSTADVEDQRMAVLEELSQYLDVTYYINDSNQLKVFTTDGSTLLDSNTHPVSFTAATSVTSQNVYPADFSPLVINGVDVTTRTDTGIFGALIELRDRILVEEQEKLDEFTNTLSRTINTEFNKGSSYPPRNILTSDMEALTGAEAFAANGFVRVAVVDEGGLVQQYADLDLSTYATVNDVVAALNGIAGMSASINVNGEIEMIADNADEGVAMNQMDSIVGPDSQTFGMYFGFNSIFTGEGSEYIRICDYLKTSSEALPGGTLIDDPVLVIGDLGIMAGDASIATAMLGVLDGLVAFNAAGDFSAQNATLSKYANKIIATLANATQDATRESETTRILYEELRTTMANETGVNIDEETAKMVELENQYEASATVLSTILKMFDTLIAAMN
ncbi:MAG: flagellar hook-associated protein FlgK [Alphaproteobacteria bacterium]